MGEGGGRRKRVRGKKLIFLLLSTNLYSEETSPFGTGLSKTLKWMCQICCNPGDIKALAPQSPI